jgi:hypothetical protein
MSTEKKKLVQALMVQAEAEKERLQALGWTQQDFAAALMQLLEEPPYPLAAIKTAYESMDEPTRRLAKIRTLPANVTASLREQLGPEPTTHQIYDLMQALGAREFPDPPKPNPRIEIAANGARVGFMLDRILSGRATYLATLAAGNWPDSEELIRLADGGGEMAAFFGGHVVPRPDGSKLITVYTD